MSLQLLVDQEVLAQLNQLVQDALNFRKEVPVLEEWYGRKKKDQESSAPYYEAVRSLKIEDVYDHHEFRIRRLSRYLLGDGLLGRAFPEVGVIEVLENLGCPDAERVLAHEVQHVRHPEQSEYEVRVATNTLHFTPNPYVSAA